MNLQKSMDADMGGTEMLQPFKAIYKTKPIKNYPRKVALLLYYPVYMYMYL